jgi:iron complex transport system substrate-binding protein
VRVLERLEPAVVAGLWIPELVRAAGGEAGDVRAPDVLPDVLVVAQRDAGLRQGLETLERLRAQGRTPRAREVVVVEGRSFFHRPGPRLVEAAEVLALALHPRRFLGRFGFGRETLARWNGG